MQKILLDTTNIETSGHAIITDLDSGKQRSVVYELGEGDAINGPYLCCCLLADAFGFPEEDDNFSVEGMVEELIENKLEKELYDPSKTTIQGDNFIDWIKNQGYENQPWTKEIVNKYLNQLAITPSAD